MQPAGLGVQFPKLCGVGEALLLIPAAQEIAGLPVPAQTDFIKQRGRLGASPHAAVQVISGHLRAAAQMPQTAGAFVEVEGIVLVKFQPLTFFGEAA